MANETTPPAAPAAETTTTEDPRIAEMTAALKSMSETVTAQVLALAKLGDENKALRAQLSASKLVKPAKTPDGDCVYLGGERHEVLNTICATAHDVEVQRGHVTEGHTFVVIAKNI
jgi:hypothetical protein